MRIVSLLGSATEIVCELGAGDLLVGVSHECDHPHARGLPRVSRPRFDPTVLSSGEIDAAVRRSMEEYGSVYEIDTALLERLRPTLILTQDVCEVCAVPTGSALEAIRALAPSPDVLSLDAHTIEQILGSIDDVARAAGVVESGEALVTELRARIERVAVRTAALPRPRVLVLEWLDPPFAPGHWVPEMVESAGGHCLIGSPGQRSHEVTLDDLGGLDPDVLLVEPCGYDAVAAAADASNHRRLLESLAPAAIRAGRAWTLDSALFSRSGPRVVQGIELLADLIHADAPDATTPHARRWP